MPAYYQIQRQIREQIEESILPPGGKLPSERELSEAYGVSRMTARKAIRGLINEGLCTKEVGTGVFVAGAKIPMNLNYVEGTGRFFRNAGVEVGTVTVRNEFVVPLREIREALGLVENEACLNLTRVRSMNREPLMIERAFVNPNILNESDSTSLGASLYETILHVAGMRPAYANGTFNIVLAGEEAAQLLDVPFNFALLVKKARVFSAGGELLEFNVATYRTDKFEFIINEQATEDSLR